MTGLVDALRQIGRDLIDKRLWPIAVLLLAAIVAVPMVIGGSPPDAAAPGAVAAVEPGAPAAAPAAAATPERKTGTAMTKLEGKVDDPFFDPPPAPDANGSAAAAAGAGAGAGAGASGSTAGSTGASTRAEAKSPDGEAAPRAGSPAASAQQGETKPATKPRTAGAKPRRVTPTPTPTPLAMHAAPAVAPSYLRTVVRVNGAGGGISHPIARLTPLGGVGDTAALFLGVAKTGARYAVFVLGPGATSQGQASCKDATNCRMIGLKAGQTQVVTVRRARGGVRRFTLRVDSIKPVRASAARARSARAHVHPDGRRVLRAMGRHAETAAVLRTVRFDHPAGLLRAAPARAVKNASE